MWNFCWKTFRKNLPSLVSSPHPQLWSLIIKMCHRILIIIPDIVWGTWGNILSTNTECLYWWRFSWRNTKWEKSKEWMETVVTAARQNTFYSLCSHQYHSFCGLCSETLNKNQQYCTLLCTTNRQLPTINFRTIQARTLSVKDYQCNILTPPPHERHTQMGILFVYPYGLCSTPFRMYCTTQIAYRNAANVYIWAVEFCTSENATSVVFL